MKHYDDIDAAWDAFWEGFDDSDCPTELAQQRLDIFTSAELHEFAQIMDGACCGTHQEVVTVGEDRVPYLLFGSYGH